MIANCFSRARVTMTAALMFLVLAAPAAASSSRCGQGGYPLGDIYLSMRSHQYVRTDCGGFGGPFVPFQFYLVIDIDFCHCGDCTWNLRWGPQAWEAQLDMSGAPEVTVISSTLSPPGSVNFASVNPTTNFLVGTGGTCVEAHQSPYVLVTFDALLSNTHGDQDQRIDIVPATPASSVSPGWNQCNPPDGILYSFYSATDPELSEKAHPYQDGFIVISPAACAQAVENSSWGNLKDGFGDD